MKKATKKEKREKRHRRVRAKVRGQKICPRVSVFRSLSHIYAQVVNDEASETIVSASDIEIKSKKSKPEKKELSNKANLAYEVGKLLAQKALVAKISKVVFDRGGYKYQGRVKALAEGARDGGLKF